jgi:hypothetical protein
METRTPAEIGASLKAAVASKRNVRGIVEDMRALAAFPPVPALAETLLGALQALKPNKKAGEENKAIRQC